jgi:hypothetical protein
MTNENYQTHVVKRDNDSDFKFEGEFVTYKSDKEQDSVQWDNLSLYRTKSGKFIAEKVHASAYDSSDTECSAQICENHEQVIAFFEHGRLAKELYKSAEIDATLFVE